MFERITRTVKIDTSESCATLVEDDGVSYRQTIFVSLSTYKITKYSYEEDKDISESEVNYDYLIASEITGVIGWLVRGLHGIPLSVRSGGENENIFSI